MTTMIADRPLSETLQALVDARLDTIDRMLVGRVNRQDRLAIVREVESQIFDQLPSGEGEPIDRDDVLAVLARLDPPEAYLPDESTTDQAPPRLRVAPSIRPTRSSTVAPESRLPLASGILGLVSLGMILVSVVCVLSLGSGDGFAVYVLILGPPFITFITGLLAVLFAAKSRLRGGWAITGLVTGIISMIVSIFGTLLIL